MRMTPSPALALSGEVPGWFLFTLLTVPNHSCSSGPAAAAGGSKKSELARQSQETAQPSIDTRPGEAIAGDTSVTVPAGAGMMVVVVVGRK